MMTMYCPACSRDFSALERYCTRCGRELEKKPNTCSAGKTPLCKHRVFQPDDRFCSYCGAPTTYALDQMSGAEKAMFAPVEGF